MTGPVLPPSMGLLGLVLEQGPRLLFIALSVYALLLLCTRWVAVRVMTSDRRFLVLFFGLQIATCITSGVLKVVAHTPVDAATWMTVLTQGILVAYLHHAVPREFRRWHHRITRHPRRRR